MATTTKKRALPEQERYARNLDEGWEVRVDCAVHGKEWAGVASALHITAPAQVSRFTLRALDEQGGDCVEGAQVSTHPDARVMSRRPALSV